MKWWWMFGILAIGGMMVVNEAWYGNSAAFGTATSMIIVTLIGLKSLENRYRIRMGVIFSLLIAGACILQYKCGSYAMLVNDDEQSPEGGRSFFWNISEHNSDRDFDKAPEF